MEDDNSNIVMVREEHIIYFEACGYKQTGHVSTLMEISDYFKLMEEKENEI